MARYESKTYCLNTAVVAKLRELRTKHGSVNKALMAVLKIKPETAKKRVAK